MASGEAALEEDVNNVQSDADEDSEPEEIFSSFGDSKASGTPEYGGKSQPDSEADRGDCEGTEANSEMPNPDQSKDITFLKKLSCNIEETLSQAKYISLLKDFVDSEFFLIDGDSLFLTGLFNKTFKSGQHLHFFYLIERFLDDFSQKGVKYVIVFFKDVENMYQSLHTRFLRTALIQHLKHNTEVTISTDFSNCLSPEWEIFLKESFPYFIIVSDVGMTKQQTDYLNIFISHTLGKKINVVLTSGQESDILRAYGYHIQSSPKHRKFFSEHQEELQDACESIIQHFSKTQDSEIHLKQHLDAIQKEVHQTLPPLNKLWPEGADIRRIVCILSCSVGLKTYGDMLKDADVFEKLNESTENDNPKESREALSLQAVADLYRMHCLCVALLLHLPLPQRARSRITGYVWKKSLSPFLRMKYRCEFVILKQLNAMSDWKVDFTYLPDLSDNLLWQNIAHYYEVDSCQGLNLELGDKILKEYQNLWSVVLKLSGNCDFGGPIPVRNTSEAFLREKPEAGETKEEIPKLGLIPMESSIVNDYAGDVLKSLPFLSSDDPAINSLIKEKEFDELTQWNFSRSLSDDYERTKRSQDVNTKDPKERRGIQKLQSFYQLLGQSMPGSRSTRIVSQVAVATKANPADKKKAKLPRKKADIIAEENLKVQKAKVENKEQEQWSTLCGSIEKEIKTNFAGGLKRLETFLKTCQSQSVKFLAEVVGLDACFKAWVEHCRKSEKSKDLDIAVQVMQRIHTIYGKYQEHLQKTHLQKLAKYLKYLGFDNLACSLSSQIMEKGSDKEISKYSVQMGAARFQLQQMGHHLFRDERSDPDPRVQYFIPDTWQRELLDVVDNNESALIVAPTSSGKTYASYYCMEKVLKESDEGVVVYVSPSKALINQVVATIYNQFTKSLPHGLVIYGVFTRDYRTDAMNCQILVTVPECLEILLLAPQHQQWAQKIRYVIFDEVHCLGGEIGADVWEHILVMIRCPFLALSATISNPKHLTEWLQLVKRYWQNVENTTESSVSANALKGSKKQKVQKAEKKSHRVRLVQYEERYNDLEKYVCSLKNDDFAIDHYHPFAALTVNHIEKYGIPSDLAFSPRESIQLYDVMADIWQEWPRAQELHPEEYSAFKNKVVITKADAKNYERELKKEITSWIELGHREKVNQLLEYLKPQVDDNPENEKVKFARFVEKLKEIDKLPAIFFMFQISSVRDFAKIVSQYLEEKQKNKQDSNVEKQEQYLKEKIKKLEKSMEKTRSALEKGSPSNKLESTIVTFENERSQLEEKLAKLTEIPPDCTFANSKAVDNETWTKIFSRLKYSANGKVLTDLALRGIGYHHEFMRIRERQVVEMLFRLGYIKVVTATGTLALGINMPCKSVVFPQDSVFLDSLNYRQMSGRAGRRGEDLIGNVFFYDIPLPKVGQLLKSNVPLLKGQFPLNISLVLRLMLLAAKADDKEDAKAKVLSVLQHPLMAFRKEKITELLKVYFIFSLQFLIKEGYLDQECNPRGFSELVASLHKHKPSNFVFVSFLERGLFHKLCKPTQEGSKVFSEDIMETLVLILANLFGRQYLPSSTVCQSEEFLGDLPEDFAAAVEEYNSKIQKNFGYFLLTVSKLADMKQECKLPLSGIDFAGTEFKDSELASHLLSGKESRTAVSPFACLSELVDQDLFDTSVVNDAILRTVGVSSSSAPVFYLKKFDEHGRRCPLSAYALDFYRQGSLEFLTQEMWDLLKNFTHLINSIRTSLEELCENEDDNVLLAFKQLSDSYSEKFSKV
ncbi:probable ATP-dependent RNA helicase DDX60 isoform X2 [Ornithorhynchus anatinus]|uniref:probable ATP-dependent RNA helicase DDX60 isoform X2 n=1 Tax=Ornithorhynchus anatinus TaxID=9258 RepID=UPI0010A8E269|nr:probable ATP-dependent RNA helicase DDX60 isoform X2 [Ornithorhynchus anatinus]